MPDIRTLWIKRKSEPRGFPELLVAWDEYCIDNYPEGFDKACQVALDACGNDVAERRYITLSTPDTEIEDAFKPARISADVSSSNG